jgi:hypothetical protein
LILLYKEGPTTFNSLKIISSFSVTLCTISLLSVFSLQELFHLSFSASLSIDAVARRIGAFVLFFGVATSLL